MSPQSSRSQKLHSLLLVVVSRARCLSRMIALRFGAVAADLHVAPAAGATVAEVQEKPLAGLAVALPHPRAEGGCEQLGGREQAGPERRFEVLICVIP